MERIKPITETAQITSARNRQQAVEKGRRDQADYRLSVELRLAEIEIAVAKLAAIVDELIADDAA